MVIVSKMLPVKICLQSSNCSWGLLKSKIELPQSLLSVEHKTDALAICIITLSECDEGIEKLQCIIVSSSKANLSSASQAHWILR